MCDIAVSFARDYLLPLIKEATNMIRGVPREVADMKDELEDIEDKINNEVRMPEADKDNRRHRIKRLKQLIEAAFGIEDVIDEYMIYEGKQPHDPGCAAKTVDNVKTMILRLQIACKIQGIKSQVRGINEGNERSDFHIPTSMEKGASSSIANQDATLNNLQETPFYLEEDEVVGFEGPRDELISWLKNERKERTVISVVGMGGQGKTTLVKKVFDSKEVIGLFDFSAWITVSQSYTIEGLLRGLLHKFCKDQNIFQLDRWSLTREVNNYLRQKRYIIVFDDVWKECFWNEIHLALAKNDKGSRIFITTRNEKVVESCVDSIIQVHVLRPLTRDKSLELFDKKAFFDLRGRCPENLRNISSEIVEKCEDLPLAIVIIAGLLYGKIKDPFEWKRFKDSLSLNPRLTAIRQTLSLSYHDLPCNLKKCLLYFGIYPEDYKIKAERLIWQWIAEGFVKKESGKTLEEVAEDYLTDLIQRSLVQVTSFTSNGKIKSCRVHDMVREMILEKIQDLSFCHFTSENEEQSVLFTEMIRRLTIANGSNNWMASVDTSNIRSLHVFRKEELPDSFQTSVPSKYKLLKVLDFEDVPLYYRVPENWGHLFNLRYLSFRNTEITNLPGSIGTLHNLETLDIRQTMVREMPREINMLRKLRHLLAYDKSKGVGYGIQMNDGIGDIKSLQTLREVEADHGEDELVTELKNLTQLRKLGLTNVKREYKSALCSSINMMQHLEKLYIAAKGKHEVLDLQFDVSAPVLRKLRLVGRLNSFPNWVGDLQYLVKLSLTYSMLTHDPLESLNGLPNLLYLSILFKAYEGERLHFPDGGFRSLKQLVLRRLLKLNSIQIGKGALCSLEKFKLVHIPQLLKVPSDVYNLPKLKVFHIISMPHEFEQSIDRDRGQHHWIIEQVPVVNIVDRFWHEINVQLQ